MAAKKKSKKSSKKSKSSSLGAKLGKQLKYMYGKYKDKVYHALYEFVTVYAEEIIEHLKHLGEIKMRIKRTIYIAAAVFLGLFMIAIGAAKYIAAIMPNLANGVSFMLLGLLILICALIYKILSD